MDGTVYKILFVVDVSNLYYCVRSRFENRRIDYRELLERVRKFGAVYRAIAYGTTSPEAKGFENTISRLGYELKLKAPKVFGHGDKQTMKANCDIDLAMDVVKILDSVDVVILGTADGDFAPLADFIRSRGKLVYAIGAGISRELKASVSDYFEIDSGYLEK